MIYNIYIIFYLNCGIDRLIELTSGYTSETLPPKRILQLKKLSVAEAQALGAPTGKAWDSLFNGQTHVFGIEFEKIDPSEVPKSMQQVRKSSHALSSIKSSSTKPKVMEVESVLEGDEIDGLFQPSSSRPVKSAKEEEEAKGREVHISANLLKKFKEYAWPHSPKEYMAWITGTIETDKKTKKQTSYADGLFFPLQSGSDWQCMEDESSCSQKLIEHCEARGCQIVGWIHSHPTFKAFFSSIDQHMMHSLQKDCAMCYGLVMDLDGEVRCLRLSPQGMEAVAACPNHNQDRNLVSSLLIFPISSSPLIK